MTTEPTHREMYRVLLYIDVFDGEPLKWDASDRATVKHLQKIGFTDCRLDRAAGGYVYTMGQQARVFLAAMTLAFEAPMHGLRCV